MSQAGTGAVESHWAGEGGPKPICVADFADATLGKAKVSAISVVAQELLNSAAQRAEAALSQELIRAGAPPSR